MSRPKKPSRRKPEPRTLTLTDIPPLAPTAESALRVVKEIADVRWPAIQRQIDGMIQSIATELALSGVADMARFDLPDDFDPFYAL